MKIQTPSNFIEIEGVRVNNLKNLSLKIPKNKITCMTGPSGSGKSSLAFHTLVAESKRRLMNCFPHNLRFFTEKPPRVDVDRLAPVLPVFGLQQINPIKGSRTNVADSLGLTHQVQSLFFSKSEQFCLKHKEKLSQLSISEQVKNKFNFKKEARLHIYINRADFLDTLAKNILPPRSFNKEAGGMRNFESSDPFWEVLRIKGDSLKKIDDFFKKVPGSSKIKGLYFLSPSHDELQFLKLNRGLSCKKCDATGIEDPSELLFSPFNASGACRNCNGFGANLLVDRDKIFNKEKNLAELQSHSLFRSERIGKYKDAFYAGLKEKKISQKIEVQDLDDKFWDFVFKGKAKWPGLDKIVSFLEKKKYKPGIRILLRGLQSEFHCDECSGARLDKQIEHFLLNKISIHTFLNSSVDEALSFIKSLKISELEESQRFIVEVMKKSLEKAIDIGLGHLKLVRKTKSLSAGEYQRVLLVKYLSFEGTDSLFVFDEPSIGLDEKQQMKLFDGLENLCEQGNTVVVVEHSELFRVRSDYEIKLGPGSGIEGGELLFEGKPKKKKINKAEVSIQKRKAHSFISAKKVEIYGKSFSKIKIPLERLVWVSGNAGSGKSSVIKKSIFNKVESEINAQYIYRPLAKITELTFPSTLRAVHVLDANLNRYTSRSTVGSLTELVKSVRKHYSLLLKAKLLNLDESFFSKNSKKGQCVKCDGRGHDLYELSYLEDIKVRCEECEGNGLKSHISSLSDGNQTFSEAISGPMGDVLSRVRLTSKFSHVFECIKKLNLEHLSLDRKMASLSGGEKQRMHLLSKILKAKDGEVFVLENVSFGLSEKELYCVMSFLRELTYKNLSILVIDHNELVSKFADYELNFSDQGKISLA